MSLVCHIKSSSWRYQPEVVSILVDTMAIIFGYGYHNQLFHSHLYLNAHREADPHQGRTTLIPTLTNLCCGRPSQCRPLLGATGLNSYSNKPILWPPIARNPLLETTSPNSYSNKTIIIITIIIIILIRWQVFSSLQSEKQLYSKIRFSFGKVKLGI